MFRLLFAVLAYVWGAFLASDDNGDDGNDDTNDDGNDNGSDKPKPEAKWTDPDVNKMKGDARKEGRATGEKNVLEAVGVESLDELKEKFAKFTTWEEDEKTELDKAADHIDKLTKRAETAESRVSELEDSLTSLRQDNAISDALAKSGFIGSRGPGLRAIDRSLVTTDDEGGVDADAAVESLKQELPGMFSEPEEPSEPVGSPPSPQPPRRDNGRERRETDKEAAETTRQGAFSNV